MPDLLDLLAEQESPPTPAPARQIGNPIKLAIDTGAFRWYRVVAVRDDQHFEIQPVRKDVKP